MAVIPVNHFGTDGKETFLDASKSQFSANLIKKLLFTERVGKGEDLEPVWERTLRKLVTNLGLPRPQKKKQEIRQSELLVKNKYSNLELDSGQSG